MAEEFGVDKTCSQDWDFKCDNLVRHYTNSCGKKMRKLHRCKRTNSVQIDERVEFLQHRRHYGLAVSNAALFDEPR